MIPIAYTLILSLLAAGALITFCCWWRAGLLREIWEEVVWQ